MGSSVRQPPKDAGAMPPPTAPAGPQEALALQARKMDHDQFGASHAHLQPLPSQFPLGSAGGDFKPRPRALEQFNAAVLQLARSTNSTPAAPRAHRGVLPAGLVSPRVEEDGKGTNIEDGGSVVVYTTMTT